MLEKKRIKSALGGLISMTSLASSLVFLTGDQTVNAAGLQQYNTNISIETVRSLVNVVPANTGISQEFHFGHPGIDITAPLGSKIRPIKEGRVLSVNFTKWDYGRSVVVDHGNGLQTLYAHMGKIYVEEGEVVTTKDYLGEVGITGRTTGPHLHLEIIKNGSRVNPRPYLLLKEE